MKIYLDPWSSDYTPSLQAEETALEKGLEVRLDVESKEWKPIASSTNFQNFVFVDGVRRIEARVILQDEGVRYGLFGSAAAGAVRMPQTQFDFLQALPKTMMIERYLILGGGKFLEEAVKVSESFEFFPVSIPGDDPEGPLQKLQQLMRQMEAKLIETDTIHDPSIYDPSREELIIADGPIQGLKPQKNPTLGYIKSFHEWYLPMSHVSELAQLQVGERTPLFLIKGTPGKLPDRFAWFVRLSPPDLGESSLAGLARLEVASEWGLEQLRMFADRTTSLSRFVSKKHQDPRSPQNLLPIGAVEKGLKHLMGDSRLIARQIQNWIRMTS